MGRWPKPTVVKLMEGNPGKRKLPEDEPQPELGIPTCPAFLGSQAKAEWKRLVGELNRIGMLAKVDRAVLAAHCQAWQDFADASENIRTRGVLIGKKNPTRNPALMIVKSATDRILQTAVHFGLTPATRARLGRFVALPKGERPEHQDDFEEFLRGGKKAR